MDKPFDVFISHSSEDGKLAIALCHYLEEKGLRCWMAPRDVPAGRDYALCIIEAIQGSKVMIVVFSENANRSPHVRNEVERAFNHNLAILPFKITNVKPEYSFEYFLGAKHWLDAVDGNAEGYFDQLFRFCKLLIDNGSGPVPPPPPPPVARPQSMFIDAFSFTGRIRRTEYGISFIIWFAIYFVTLIVYNVVNAKTGLDDPTPVSLLCYLGTIGLLSWFSLAQGAKRCHDIDRIGWYQLIPFYFFVLLFKEGSPDKNRFGNNPKKYGDIIKQSYTFIYPGIAVVVLIVLMAVSGPRSSGGGYSTVDSTATTRDTSSIIFKNNFQTPLYIAHGGKTDTIPQGESLIFRDTIGHRFKCRAMTWVESTDSLKIFGKAPYWDVDTVYNKDAYYYDGLVNENFFLLKITNSSDTDISKILVNTNSLENVEVVDIHIPHTGSTYLAGYYKIYDDTKIRITDETGAGRDYENKVDFSFSDCKSCVLRLEYK